MSKFKVPKDDRLHPDQLHPPTHEEDPILSLSEVGRQLGKTPTTISNWIRDGLLQAVRMPSGLFGVRKSAVNKFLVGTTLPVKEIA